VTFHGCSGLSSLRIVSSGDRAAEPSRFIIAKNIFTNPLKVEFLLSNM
jgi:hypothetical protein